MYPRHPTQSGPNTSASFSSRPQIESKTLKRKPKTLIKQVLLKLLIT